MKLMMYATRFFSEINLNKDSFLSDEIDRYIANLNQ